MSIEFDIENCSDGSDQESPICPHAPQFKPFPSSDAFAGTNIFQLFNNVKQTQRTLRTPLGERQINKPRTKTSVLTFLDKKVKNKHSQ